jgi:hypothetical protein
MARKKTPGNRYSNGRKKQPGTNAERNAKVAASKPNPRVIAMRDFYAHPKLHKGKAAAEAYDPIGKLFATLWLEGHGHDSKEMVRIAREYGALFYERFGQSSGGSMEPSCLPQGSGRPPASCQPEGRSARYERLCEALGCGPERLAVREIILNYHGSDEVPAWVARMVNERRYLLGLSYTGWRMIDQDKAKLAELVRGLVRLVDGALPARFERAA